MTDVQILAAFFPEKLPQRPQKYITPKEAFWTVNKHRGLTESQIQAAWKQHTRGG